MSFLDDIDETALVPVEPAPFVRRSSEQKQLDGLQKREDRIYAKSMATVEDYSAAREIDPSAKGPPPEWVTELGEVEAQRRWRVALSAWANKKDAPVFLELAKSTALGIMKARAGQNLTVNALNATFLIAAPPKAQKAYAIIDVEEEPEDEK